MIFHLAPNGKIAMVLANGSLSSQSGDEGDIRRKIIEDDLVEGIIAMPTQLFTPHRFRSPCGLSIATRYKSNVQNLHIPNSDKLVAFYNFDVILAVGHHL